MALHGHIEVNGQPIGSWSARRTTPGPDADGTAVYECHTTMYADDPPRVQTFHLRHAVADGALALATAVLTTAHGIASGLPARRSPIPNARSSGGQIERVEVRATPE